MKSKPRWQTIEQTSIKAKSCNALAVLIVATRLGGTAHTGLTPLNLTDLVQSVQSDAVQANSHISQNRTVEKCTSVNKESFHVHKQKLHIEISFSLLFV